MTTENNVAAQAGDEPMRAAQAQAHKLRGMATGPAAIMYGYGVLMTAAADTIDRLAALVSPRATADVERDAEIAKVIWQLISDGVLDHVLSGSDESGHEESFNSDTEEMAYLIASIKSARTRIATTKPGA